MAQALTSVLMIDDDTALAQGLGRLLLKDGFLLETVARGEAGMREALSGRYAMVLLDVMLPDADGRALLKRLREKSDVPVIMLTARGDDQDRIEGLESGADDFLPKPFNPRELIARIRAVLKRQHSVAAPAGLMQVSDLTVRPSTREVLLKDVQIILTGAEYDVLVCLLRSAGEVVSRDVLAETALGRPLGVFDRSVDNHVSNLRKKLGPGESGDERIRNVRGSGYLYLGSLSSDASVEDANAGEP